MSWFLLDLCLPLDVVVAVAVAEEEALVAVYDRYDVKDGDDRYDGNQ